MSLNLMAASNQWSTRPEDERFPNLRAAFEAAKEMKVASREKKDVLLSTIRTEAVGSEVMLVGKGNTPSRLSYPATGQLCRYTGAPTGYIQSLPPTLAAQNLNHGLSKLDGRKVTVFAYVNGGILIRDLNTEIYERFYHADVLSRVQDLPEYGWKVPPARPAFPNQRNTRPATDQDVLEISGGGGVSVKVGDLIADAGIYLGWGTPELFVFLINTKNRIQDGSAEGLSRGVFISNSEVMGTSFRVTTFLFRHVCGNHIVWGAEGVKEIRFKHVGDINQRANRVLSYELRKIETTGANALEAKISKARGLLIGKTKDDVLDALFGKKVLGRADLASAYDTANRHRDQDGDPRSHWGMAQGITRMSQIEQHADTRNSLDRAAGKVLDLAF